jgi:hypothetical protein
MSRRTIFDPILPSPTIPSCISNSSAEIGARLVAAVYATADGAAHLSF